MKKLILLIVLLTFSLLFTVRYSLGIEETIVFKKAFVVRKVEGIIKSAVGLWPKDYASKHVIFTLYDTANPNKSWRIKLDNNGKFKQKVPQGKYKFKIEVSGWDDAEGTIIVTKKAKKKARIKIILNLS